MEQNLERGMWRGKRLDDNQWIIGWPVKYPNEYYPKMLVVTEKNGVKTWTWWEVDPSTLGEYTGKNDLFENDIFEDVCGTRYRVVWRENGFMLEHKFKRHMDGATWTETGYMPLYSRRGKVIGNAIDSQDLLGGTE